MLIEKSFYYTAHIRRHRKQKFEEVRIADKVPMELVEVSANEAPLVFEIEFLDRWYSSKDDIGIVIGYRHFDGEFWVPLMDTPHNEKPRIRSLDDAVETSSSAPTTHWPPVASLDDPQIVEVINATRDAEIIECARQFKDLLVIDGVPHTRVPEPAYALPRDNRERFPRLSLVNAIDNEERGEADYLKWRVDRFDEMVSHFEAIRNEPLDDGDRERFERLRAKMHRPDLLTFNDERAALLATSKEIVESTRLEEFQAGTMEFFAAYVGARDERLKAEPDEAALIAHLEQLLHGPDQFGWTSYHDKVILMAAARWRNSRGELNPDDTAALSF